MVTKILDQESYNKIKKDGVLVFTDIKQWVIKGCVMDLVKRKVTLEGDFDSDCLVDTKYEYWNGWVNPYLNYEDSKIS